MKKLLPLLIFLLFFTTLSFSQEVKKNDTTKKVSEKKEEISKNEKVFEKNVPTEKQSTPEEFYIVNDKPVTREVYIKHLKNNH